MRSSDARSRSALADAGRRTSKSLKLRLSKQVPPLCPPCTGEAPQPHQSLLYSQQLWTASGHIHQRLSCDRHLYYPELAVAAPVLKQVPVDNCCDVQQGKRAKLAGGQYRRSFRDAASACDSTPPSTPYRPSRQQQQLVEERAYSTAFTTTSSSSSHDLIQSRRHSACSALADGQEDTVMWPLVVTGKQQRSRRCRRTQWNSWPPILRDSAASGSCDAAAAAVTGPCLQLDHQQRIHQLHSLQQHQVAAHISQQGSLLKLQQQECRHYEQQEACPSVAGMWQTPLHQVAVQEIAAAFPSTASVCASADCKVKVGAKAAAIGGDSSPGQETSQLSDMTMCCTRDSPRSAVRVALSSWPSTSTDSDCQVQPQECIDLHKTAAGKRTCGGVSASLESASSPLHEVF